MGWSYRKRIKIIPGVHLNISKRGISTTIGVRGASVNFSSSGTRVNTSIMGFSNSYNISNSRRRSNETASRPQNNFNPEPYFSDNIFSAEVHEITSQNMQGIKESIIMAQNQKHELRKDLSKIEITLTFTKTKKTISYILLYGFINKKIPNNLNIDIKAQREAIIQTKNQIENSIVNLEIDFDLDIKRKFDQLYQAFVRLTTSRKIWDITSAHYQDRVATRSSANTLVKRIDVNFSVRSLPFIKSEYQALYFKNANGADLYFYPTFVVMYTNDSNFAIIGIDELHLFQSNVRFTETSAVPSDSKIIDRTWAKVNRNGTRDKRFKNNFQIPVVRYGTIQLKTRTGLNEEYQFSNLEFTEAFGKAFRDYQAEFKSKIY